MRERKAFQLICQMKLLQARYIVGVPLGAESLRNLAKIANQLAGLEMPNTYADRVIMSPTRQSAMATARGSKPHEA